MWWSKNFTKSAVPQNDLGSIFHLCYVAKHPDGCDYTTAELNTDEKRIVTTPAEFVGMLDTEISFKMWNDAFATWLAAIPAEIKLAATVNTKPQDVWAQKAH